MRTRTHRRAKAIVLEWQLSGWVIPQKAPFLTASLARELDSERANAANDARDEMNQLADFPPEFIGPILKAAGGKR